MDPSAAVKARVREEAEKLLAFYDRIMGCRVMVEVPHRHHQRGKRFHIRIDLTVPRGEIIVKQEPSVHSIQQAEHEKGKKDQGTATPHKDIYVVIRDAFKAARRQLQDYARKQEGNGQASRSGAARRISKLYPRRSLWLSRTP